MSDVLRPQQTAEKIKLKMKSKGTEYMNVLSECTCGVQLFDNSLSKTFNNKTVRNLKYAWSLALRTLEKLQGK